MYMLDGFNLSQLHDIKQALNELELYNINAEDYLSVIGSIIKRRKLKIEKSVDDRNVSFQNPICEGCNVQLIELECGRFVYPCEVDKGCLEIKKAVV